MLVLLIKYTRNRPHLPPLRRSPCICNWEPEIEGLNHQPGKPLPVVLPILTCTRVHEQDGDKGWIRSYSLGMGYRNGRTVISWLLLLRLGTEFSHWIRMVTSGTGDLWGFCSALIWEIVLFSALQIYFAKVTGQLWKCALWSRADFSLFSLHPPKAKPPAPPFFSELAVIRQRGFEWPFKYSFE